MAKKDNDIGIPISKYSPSVQFSIILLIVGGFFGLIFLIGNYERQANLRFESICDNPRIMSDISCYDLQEAINVCPEASLLFYDMNCSMANRTMRMVR